MALLAATAGTLALAPKAAAQFRYETPDGHQTIGSSQMLQQPSLNEEFSKATGKTIPNAAPGVPGLPNIQSASTGNPPSAVPAKPGLIGTQNQSNQTQGSQSGTNANMQKAQSQNKNTAPQSNATAPGGTAQPGAIILPQGEASTVRVGPVEHITLAQRAFMAAWLILQFVVISVVAVVATVNAMRDRARYQGGHAIREDYRDPLRTGV